MNSCQVAFAVFRNLHTFSQVFISCFFFTSEHIYYLNKHYDAIIQ